MRRAGNVDLGEVYAAADTMLGFLRGNGLSVALMGGLSLHARGSGRTTSDVDIAVDANMARVKQVMASQQRYLSFDLLHLTLSKNFEAFSILVARLQAL